MFIGFSGLGLVGLLVLTGCVGHLLTVERSIGMTQPNFELGKLTPQTRFTLKDVIRVETYLTWPDATGEGGLHDLQWRWFRSGVLVSRTTRDNQSFDTTPFSLWTSKAAASLGQGDYTVDVVVDDKLVVTNKFSISPG